MTLAHLLEGDGSQGGGQQLPNPAIRLRPSSGFPKSIFEQHRPQGVCWGWQGSGLPGTSAFLVQWVLRGIRGPRAHAGPTPHSGKTGVHQGSKADE